MYASSAYKKEKKRLWYMFNGKATKKFSTTSVLYIILYLLIQMGVHHNELNISATTNDFSSESLQGDAVGWSKYFKYDRIQLQMNASCFLLSHFFSLQVLTNVAEKTVCVNIHLNHLMIINLIRLIYIHTFTCICISIL